MSLFSYSKELLSTTAPAGAIGPSTDQTGKKFICLTPAPVSNRAFRVMVDLQVSGGTSNPTATVHVETSHDGATWIPATAPVTQAGDGSKRSLMKISTLLSRVRVRTELGGETKPAHKALVVLVSNADLRMKE